MGKVHNGDTFDPSDLLPPWMCLYVDEVFAHTHTHRRTHIHTHAHAHTNTRTYTHTYTHIYTHARTHAHTHTHTHTHIQAHMCHTLIPWMVRKQPQVAKRAGLGFRV